MTHSTELSYDECRELLAGASVGRVALSTPTGPHIIPVNYSLVGTSIVFRTTPYSVVGTYGWNTPLAFEVDQLDHATHSGWSVVASGHGRMVPPGDELDQIRSLWDPEPWADGPRQLYVRLPWRTLSGRRLGDGWTPLSGIGGRQTA